MTTKRTRSCGCYEPDRYTIIRLPDPMRAFQMKQHQRRRDRRVGYAIVAAYVAAVATLPAAVIDSLTEDRFVWGWPVIGFLLVVCGRTWEVGTSGVRGRFHEPSEARCAVEMFEANVIHAKREAEVEVGAPGGQHVERGAYAAQQRAFWTVHEADLERFEANLARHAEGEQ